jgi:hypothetical protein
MSESVDHLQTGFPRGVENPGDRRPPAMDDATRALGGKTAAVLGGLGQVPR